MWKFCLITEDCRKSILYVLRAINRQNQVECHSYSRRLWLIKPGLKEEIVVQASICIGPGKRGHIVADTLLPTQMFPRLPASATFVADSNFVPGTQKMFLIVFRNILCPQQMFPSLRNPRNIMGNNVSATMCPRLPGPYDSAQANRIRSLSRVICILKIARPHLISKLTGNSKIKEKLWLHTRKK